MIELTAKYDQDSKRYHRFAIQKNEHGITGSIYVPKHNTIPNLKQLTVNLEVEKPETG